MEHEECQFGYAINGGTPCTEVRELLALSVGRPTVGRLNALLAEYAGLGCQLFSIKEAGVVVGIIGLYCNSPGRATIGHIATAPAVRGRGIGRRLINEAAKVLGVRELVAETDQDAVGFYAKLGFTITSTPSGYPGILRFTCRKSAD